MLNVIFAVLYGRVSTDKQADEGTSLTTQREMNNHRASLLAASVVEYCEDAGVSGARYKSRPGIQRAVSLIESGQASVLIVSKLDRLGRTTRIILDIAERIDRVGGRIITCDGQELGGTPSGKMMLAMLAAMAEFERNTTRERSMVGRRSRAKEGIQPSRSLSPFGYTIVKAKDMLLGTHPGHSAGEYVIVEEKARWVRSIFSMYAAGGSLRDVIRFLTENGVLTSKGNRIWYRGSVLAILGNPVYKGIGAYGRTQARYDESRTERGFKTASYVVPAAEESIITFDVPPLVDPETWERCQERRATNKARLSGNPSRRYLLSGFMRCPLCGCGMTGKGGDIRARRYYCCRKANSSTEPGVSQCVSKNYPIDKTEQLIIQKLLSVAKEPERMKAAILAYNAQEPDDNREVEANALRIEMDGLKRQEDAAARAQIDALTSGRSGGVYDRLLNEISEKQKAIQQRLCALNRQDAPTQKRIPLENADILAEMIADAETALTAADEDVTIEEKNRLLGTLIESITPEGAGFRIQTVYCIRRHRRCRHPNVISLNSFRGDWQ